MKLRSLVDAPIKRGSRVLVRIDSDVAVKNGIIAAESAYRLDSALPTLKFLIKKGARITIMGHRGRPAGKKLASLSLAPVQKYLEKKLRAKLRCLPNVRFDAREEKNDLAYARELAAGQEIFVNESFATAHRAHASTAAITRVLPSYAGLQFEKEVGELTKLFTAKQPLAVIIGGAKIDTKIPLIKKFLPQAQHLFVVGAAANAFFAACGFEIGASRVDSASVAAARKLMRSANMPAVVDVMVGDAKHGKKFRAVALADMQTKKICEPHEAILDVGPATLVMMSEMLAGARTIIWNGPAGVFEREPFHLGTERIARLLARLGRRGAHVVAGGGETVTAILQHRMSRGFAHISTGGGAMLAFLGGERLPAIDALMRTGR